MPRPASPKTPRYSKSSRLAKESPKEPLRLPSDVSISDLDVMEKNAIDKANKAITAIENAFAVWDAAATKPEDLKPRILRLKYFYETLTNWERKALQTLGKSDQIGPRVERLKEFTEILQAYA